MEDVEAALRATRPEKVFAVLDDDREVPVAIPRGSRRWERMAATVNSQPWVELRMCDKSGALLAAPLTRGDDKPAPAPELEDISGTRADRMIDAGVAERLVRFALETAMRSFTEVAKVMRSSGSAEVTAALTANRETVAAAHAMIGDYRGQLEEANQRVRDLESELAARLAEDAKPREPEPKSGIDALVENFAGGFLSASQPTPPANGAKVAG